MWLFSLLKIVKSFASSEKGLPSIFQAAVAVWVRVSNEKTRRYVLSEL